MIKRILIAYDGSESADKAFRLALSLAKEHHASLSVLAVSRPPDFAEDVETEAIIENSQRHYRKLLSALKPQAASEGIDAQFEVRVGHPAEQIIYYAEKNLVDLIVVGHRGHSFFERLRLGSVSRQIIDYANCAVLVAR